MATQMNSTLRLLRTAAGYAALALAVSVGGVVVGAAVVAPAVARTKPFVQRVLGEASTAPLHAPLLSASSGSETSGGSVGQADGDGVMADGVLASVRVGIASVPRLGWLFVDVLLVLAAGAYWFVRQRALGTSIAGSELARRSAAALPSRLTPGRLSSGRSSRTPKAVAALAEAGTAPADIARRTGLPLDAVAMLLSMASFGGRQLQPPTA